MKLRRLIAIPAIAAAVVTATVGSPAQTADACGPVRFHQSSLHLTKHFSMHHPWRWHQHHHASVKHHHSGQNVTVNIGGKNNKVHLPFVNANVKLRKG